VTNAVAEEIVMICTFYDKDRYEGKSETEYLKYSNPLIGRKQIYDRVDGKWKKWCRPSEHDHKPCELTVSDKGAVGTFYVKDTLKKPELGKPAGFKYVVVFNFTFDFEFLKKRVDYYFETLSGRRIWGDKIWERWSCKLHSKEE
tara:strand:- start:478 stop:909 length:432 start_codon:yes stop_codon:yes gene_type:complete